MTVKGGTTPACAVCKYQRRKCSPSCPLAPYFPANEAQMFQNVHRLFGVSNVTKILEGLKSKEERDEAMTSIIYEAEMRHKFPVHGCSAVLTQLGNQVQSSVDELRSLYAQIAAFREQLVGNGFDVGPSTNHMGVGASSYSFLDEGGGGGPLYLEALNSDSATLESVQAQMNVFGIQEEEEEEGSNDMYFDDLEGEDDPFATALKSSPFASPIQETTTTSTSENISDVDVKSAGFNLTVRNF